MTSSSVAIVGATGLTGASAYPAARARGTLIPSCRHGLDPTLGFPFS